MTRTWNNGMLIVKKFFTESVSSIIPSLQYSNIPIGEIFLCSTVITGGWVTCETMNHVCENR